jgi:hydroxymethylpyrimidine pyrophosphatase-like HAD family hydrolase
MNDVKERFMKAGIPYDDIDKEMIEVIDLLNFKLNLKTEFCCYGHQINEQGYIIFSDTVKDEEIQKLFDILKDYNNDYCFSFNKWLRRASNITLQNWTIYFPNYQCFSINEDNIKLYEYNRKYDVSVLTDTIIETQ